MPNESSLPLARRVKRTVLGSTVFRSVYEEWNLDSPNKGLTNQDLRFLMMISMDEAKRRCWLLGMFSTREVRTYH